MNNSDVHDFSRLAAGSYGDAHKEASMTNYLVHPNAGYSDHNMTTYHHKNDVGNIVIAHRGTAPGSKGGTRDLSNDLAFMGGMGGGQGRMRRRMRQTEKILEATKPTSFHLTGHSLGGATVNHTIANSKVVRDNLTSAHTFNAAAHPTASNRQGVSKKSKRRLKNKVTHHRIENDAVSLGFRTNTPFGKVNTIPHPDKGKKMSMGKQILTGIAGFTLGGVSKRSFDAHGIGNFHAPSN
jgi:hypothetical protein